VCGTCLGGVSVNFPMLVTGRMLVGAGVGLSIQASPLYISEMAPAQQRGMLNIMFQLMITVGILTANRSLHDQFALCTRNCEVHPPGSIG